MKIKVRIPSPLRRFTGHNNQVEVEAGTVNQALHRVVEKYPDLGKQIFDETDSLRNFVKVFLDQQDIGSLSGLETPLDKANEIRIVPAIAGGEDAPPRLTPSELSRYSRHIMLPEIGMEGQQKLKSARVLVVGAGGLGSPLCLYLAAAGVGTIGVVDHDLVEDSNLQRQVLFTVQDIGQSKAVCAAEHLQQLNPHIRIESFETALTSENALEIIRHFDLVIDGTDNFPTRYLVNDACVLLKKPNIYGSIFRFEGQATLFNHGDGPCYRCMYPEPPPPGLVPSCAEGGVLGILPAMIASIQCTEAIKIIAGIGETLSGRLILYDALAMSFHEVAIRRDPHCCLCGDNPTVTELVDYHQFCGINANAASDNIEELSPEQLKQRLDTQENLLLIDVRELYEREICAIDGSEHIPLGIILEDSPELAKNQPLVFYCKSGVRSAQACTRYEQLGYEAVFNLKGGILAWADVIDPELAKY